MWNEASAVGLQFVVWLSLTTAAAILWIGSAEAVPYALVLLAVVGLPSLVSISYARRLDVSIDAPPRIRPWRLVPYCVIAMALFSGWFRATDDQNFWQRILATGLFVALWACAEVAIRVRRQEETLDGGEAPGQ